MNIKLGKYHLRRPEPKDIEEIYSYKNDREIINLLGGFSTGFSRKDIAEWIELHRNHNNEIVWVIATSEDDRCCGHVGLYQIDYRVRKAEFAICIGDKNLWGKNIGRLVARTVVDFAFSQLNLHRVQLIVLENNERAIKLYKIMGFKCEGKMRDYQFKNNVYINALIMSILEDEWKSKNKQIK